MRQQKKGNRKMWVVVLFAGALFLSLTPLMVMKGKRGEHLREMERESRRAKVATITHLPTHPSIKQTTTPKPFQKVSHRTEATKAASAEPTLPTSEPSMLPLPKLKRPDHTTKPAVLSHPKPTISHKLQHNKVTYNLRNDSAVKHEKGVVAEESSTPPDKILTASKYEDSFHHNVEIWCNLVHKNNSHFPCLVDISKDGLLQPRVLQQTSELVSLSEPHHHYKTSGNMSEKCKAAMDTGNYEVIVETTPLRVSEMDVIVGTIDSALRVSDPNSCLQFSHKTGQSDYYSTAYNRKNEKGKAKVEPCENQLQLMIQKSFGYPDHPDLDTHVLEEGTAVHKRRIHISLKRRSGFQIKLGETSPVEVPFQLPLGCVLISGARMRVHPPHWNATTLEIVPLEKTEIGISGNIVKSALATTMLMDGGVSGSFVLPKKFSNISEWAKLDNFEQLVRTSLSKALGAPTSGEDEIYVEESYPNVITFTLAPRHHACLVTSDSHNVTFDPIETNVNGQHVIIPFFKPNLLVFSSAEPHLSSKLTGEEQASEGSLLVQAGTTKRLDIEVAFNHGVFLNMTQGQEVVVSILQKHISSILMPEFENVNIMIASNSLFRITAQQAANIDKTVQPVGHIVKILSVPDSVLCIIDPELTVGDVASGSLKFINRKSDTPVAVTPNIVVLRQTSPEKRKTIIFDHAIIGGGVSGLNGMGRLLESRNYSQLQNVLWVDRPSAGVDRAFQMGRMNQYKTVLSTQNCVQFTNFFRAFPSYSKALGADGQSLVILKHAAEDFHCVLNTFVEPMLEITRMLQTHVVSVVGGLSGFKKIYHNGQLQRENNNSTFDFTWELDIKNEITSNYRILVKGNLILALGGVMKPMDELSQKVPTVPLMNSLNPIILKNSIKKFKPKDERKSVAAAVLGSGPTAFIVKYNLARIPWINKIYQVVKLGAQQGRFVQTPVYRWDGTEAEVEKVIFNLLNNVSVSNMVEEVKDLVSFSIQAIGWREPSDFTFNGTFVPDIGKVVAGPKLINIGSKKRPTRLSGRYGVTVVNVLLRETTDSRNCSSAMTCFKNDYPPPPDTVFDADD